MESNPMAFMLITFVVIAAWGAFVSWLTRSVMHKRLAEKSITYSLFHLADPSNALRVSQVFEIYGCGYYVVSYNGMLNTLEGVTRSISSTDRLRGEVKELREELQELQEGLEDGDNQAL